MVGILRKGILCIFGSTKGRRGSRPSYDEETASSQKTLLADKNRSVTQRSNHDGFDGVQAVLGLAEYD